MNPTRKSMRLFRSPLTDNIYASTAYKAQGPTEDRLGELITITGVKHDVTADFHAIAKAVAA